MDGTGRTLLDHPIVVRVAAFLQAEGVSAWPVGGVVRDALLGRPLHDLDFAVAGDGLELARRLSNELRGAFVPLDDERRVGRVVITHAGQQLFVDLAALRGEGELEADLRLRDFTVNAMAVETTSGQLIDPTGGRHDLKTGLIRAVSEDVFHDDPLRMLRAIRLAGQLSFEIETATLALIRRDAGLIVQPSAERVRDELLALLALSGAADRVRRLETLGLLDYLLPELLLSKGVVQSQPHTFDVYEHTLAVLDALERLLQPLFSDNPADELDRQQPGETEPAVSTDLWAEGAPLGRWRQQVATHLAAEVSHNQPRRLLLKLAALLHDIGKPETRTVGEDGRIHFYRHEVVGAEIAGRVLRRLKMPARSRDRVARIIAGHLRPLQLSQKLPPSRRAIYRYFRATGDAGPDIALLSIADQRGKEFAEDRSEVVAVVQSILEAYFDEHDELVVVRPLLSGKEILAISGLEPGPQVGQLIERLREAQASGAVSDRESAIQYLRSLT